MDPEQFVGGSQHVRRTDFGATHVMPDLQGEFVDLLGAGDSAGRECEPTREKLDVENPATRERFGQDGAQLVGDTEQFCPALRVVDGTERMAEAAVAKMRPR